MSDIKHLYKSDRDTDGTPNCGEEDYYYAQAFNEGLSKAEKFFEKKIDELEKKYYNLCFDINETYYRSCECYSTNYCYLCGIYDRIRDEVKKSLKEKESQGE